MGRKLLINLNKTEKDKLRSELLTDKIEVLEPSFFINLDFFKNYFKTEHGMNIKTRKGITIAKIKNLKEFKTKIIFKEKGERVNNSAFESLMDSISFENRLLFLNVYIKEDENKKIKNNINLKNILTSLFELKSEYDYNLSFPKFSSYGEVEKYFEELKKEKDLEIFYELNSEDEKFFSTYLMDKQGNFIKENKEFICKYIYGLSLLQQEDGIEDLKSLLIYFEEKNRDISEKSQQVNQRIEFFILTIEERIFLEEGNNYSELKGKYFKTLNKFYQKIKIQNKKNIVDIYEELAPFFISSPLREEVFYYFLMLEIINLYLEKKYPDKKVFYNELLGENKNAIVVGNGYVKGHRNMTLNILIKIAKLLDLDSGIYSYYLISNEISNFLSCSFSYEGLEKDIREYKEEEISLSENIVKYKLKDRGIESQIINEMLVKEIAVIKTAKEKIDSPYTYLINYKEEEIEKNVVKIKQEINSLRFLDKKDDKNKELIKFLERVLKDKILLLQYLQWNKQYISEYIVNCFGLISVGKREYIKMTMYITDTLGHFKVIDQECGNFVSIYLEEDEFELLGKIKSIELEESVQNI